MKIKSENIEQPDLEEFLKTESDFAFEMQTLSLLRNLGFRCSHSGNYSDPVTNIIRQYDLRAEIDGENHKLALAVECKNLKPSFPLLVNAVPRTADEAFHDYVVLNVHTTMQSREVRPIKNGKTGYRAGEMVGKQTDQVGRTEKGELLSNDSDTYKKVSQAINSSKEVLVRAASNSSPPYIRVVIPVLVIPANVLWQVEYDAHGKVTKQPHRVEEATIFIDQRWSVSIGVWALDYRISHLHIVTFPHLEKSVNRWLGPIGFFPGTY